MFLCLQATLTITLSPGLSSSCPRNGDASNCYQEESSIVGTHLPAIKKKEKNNYVRKFGSVTHREESGSSSRDRADQAVASAAVPGTLRVFKPTLQSSRRGAAAAARAGGPGSPPSSYSEDFSWRKPAIPAFLGNERK